MAKRWLSNLRATTTNGMNAIMIGIRIATGTSIGMVIARIVIVTTATAMMTGIGTIAGSVFLQGIIRPRANAGSGIRSGLLGSSLRPETVAS
jgi:hypothetical protein